MATIHHSFGLSGLSLPDPRDYHYTFTRTQLSMVLPPLVDLRSKLPPVYDQGQLGSCTSFAIAKGALEYQYNKQVKALPPGGFSALFHYYQERLMEHDILEDAGATMRTGMKALAKYGVCPDSDWPYIIETFANHPSRQAVHDAHLERGSTYQRVAQDLNTMRRILASDEVFVIGVSVFESFVAPIVDATGDIPMPNTKREKHLGGHAICIIGYDDVSRVFYFRNSWSDQWGNQGYGSIPYVYLTATDLAGDAWTITLAK